MDLDILKDFMDTHGVDFKEAGERIYLKECFECGNSKWKVSFRDPSNEKYKSLWGICFRCSATFSTYSYLIDLGFDRKSVKDAHGFGSVMQESGDVDFTSLLIQEDAVKEKAAKAPYRPGRIDISGYFSIDSWPKHPASIYARARGVQEGLDRHILTDPETNSVVFLCIEDNVVVGWQKRFVNPFPSNFKTLNPPADIFKKSQHVIEYPNHGPIVVCEGPFTGVAAWNFGYHALVTFGSGVSMEQIQKIGTVAERTGKPIYVSFDLDAAGYRGFFKIKNYFNRRDVEVLRLVPETGNDLNDSWQAGTGASLVHDDGWDSTVPILDVFGDIYKSRG